MNYPIKIQSSKINSKIISINIYLSCINYLKTYNKMFEILKSLFYVKKSEEIANKSDKVEIETRRHKFNYEIKSSSRYNIYSHDLYTKYF